MSIFGGITLTKAAGEMIRDSSILDMPYRVLVSAVALLSIGGVEWSTESVGGPIERIKRAIENLGHPIENLGQVLRWLQMPDYLSNPDSWLSLAREWIHAVPELSSIATVLLFVGFAFMAHGDGPQGAANLRAGSTAVLMFLLIWERSGIVLVSILTLVFALVTAVYVRVRGKIPGRFGDFFGQGLTAMSIAVLLDVFLIAVALYAAPRDAIGLYRKPSERAAIRLPE